MNRKIVRGIKVLVAAVFVIVLALNVNTTFKHSSPLDNDILAEEVDSVRAQVCRTECELWVDCTGNGIPETYCGEMVVIACNTQAPEFMWTWCTASVTVTPPLMLSGGSRSGGYNCCPS